MSDDLPHPERAEIRIEAVLHALADPVRLYLVREMNRIGTGVACGAIELPVTKSTRTHHLRTLREAGVLRIRKEGTARIATIRRDDLDARYPGLLTAILSADHESRAGTSSQVTSSPEDSTTRPSDISRNS